MAEFKVGDKIQRKKKCMDDYWFEVSAMCKNSPTGIFTVTMVDSKNPRVFQVEGKRWMYSSGFELVAPKKPKKYL